jgi:hypothetical protein
MMPKNGINLPRGAAVLCTTIFLLMATGNLPGADESFTGEVVRAPAQTLAPGAAELVLALELPDGYELLRDTPILAAITSGDAGVVSLGRESRVTCRQPQFPLRLPLQARPGETELQADLVLYYCKKEGPGLCITKEARLLLPVKVDQASPNRELKASYKLPAL